MSPELEIKARNMDVTDKIRDYIKTKSNKLNKFLPAIDETRIELSFIETARNVSDRHVAQITVRGKHLLLRSEEHSDEIISAFDIAIEKLHRQIDRFKGKHYRGRGDGRSAADIAPGPEIENFDDEEPVVVRRKRFRIYPMNEDEAIEQMNLLGHNNFFIFFDADDNQIKVLYRRRNGAYGLIEPELD
ncbi:MAG: ribosome-associated translation inhibitor RaiA [Anaerolineae bacterium]|nr:ribosome-associated translation inhibitor RaiA [Anaerolineae bacterium]MDK1080277.1 ribosome-associated translation inhibitor RaiA [Anaerolineae bacterium]MDK1118337.1 ribosome-associated translation inhibitor RaiA [Anaerolineae bacterium]